MRPPTHRPEYQYEPIVVRGGCGACDACHVKMLVMALVAIGRRKQARRVVVDTQWWFDGEGAEGVQMCNAAAYKASASASKRTATARMPSLANNPFKPEDQWKRNETGARRLVVPEVEGCDACLVQLLATVLIVDGRADLAQRLVSLLFGGGGASVACKFVVAPAPFADAARLLRTVRSNADVAVLVAVLENAQSTRANVVAAVGNVVVLEPNTTPETVARLMLALRPECGVAVAPVAAVRKSQEKE